MKIRQKKFCIEYFPSLRVAKMKNLDGSFEVENFSYFYSLFTAKHCKDSKIIEYAIYE